ncbi:hypothetical protein HPB52_024344 [Rhipicephalus sanguineus]|uniref:Uncharacterized protein n=1 Tax=Rhipicephalus sanguineus TaxID=34632 RepID=A0A9D4YR33_RHISA|nr:hypothetical protein HPB52_024344 [Rhipicephalus sanguineus]
MASREKAKGQHATTKSGRLPRRWVACFVLAIIQLIIGLGLLAVGAADVVFTLDHKFVSFNVVTCLATYTGDKTTALFAVILSKVVLTYACHVLGGVCAGVAVPDLCRNGAGLVTFDTFHRDVAAKQMPQNQTSSAPPPRLLPAAQLGHHVQEAPGTGEKLTVVTLPEADVIYAVPENSYVVRRPEGSYVAPPGNSRLAPFFPTYTRVAIE